MGVGEALGVAVGVADGFAVAPFLRPVTIKTSEVPEPEVEAVTF